MFTKYIALVIALVGLVAAKNSTVPAHNYANLVQVNYPLSEDPCLLFSFDKMVISAVDPAKNSSYVIAPSTINNITQSDVSDGMCPDWIPVDANRSTFSAKFSIIQDDLILEFYFIQGDTIYRGTNISDVLNGTQLTTLSYIRATNATSAASVSFAAEGVNSWADPHLGSINCGLQFNFTTDVNSTFSGSVNVTHVQLQVAPEAGQSGFYPAVDSISCLVDKHKRNNVGLIVGGIIAGFAVLGIIAFTYTQCTKRRSAYDPIM